MAVPMESFAKLRLRVALLSLAVSALYLPATLHRTLTGDEPHHLVMAASLAWDQDLDLENNYAEARGLPFDPRDSRSMPDPHVLRDARGRWRPKHEPGLPLLFAPWLRLAGFGGVLSFLALVYAALGVVLWELGLALNLDSRALRTLVALFCSVAPIPYYALQLFPETTAALLVVGFALGLVKRPSSAMGAVWLGCMIAFLPWLRLRFVPLAIAAAIVVGMFWRGKLRLAFFVPIGLSALAQAWYFFRFFGRFLPPPSTHQGFGPLSVALKGMAGLFLDGQVGLLVLSPVFLLVFPFFKAALPPREGIGLFSILALGGTVALCGSYQDFPAGWCPQPARYLVVLLPLLLLPVAVGLCQLQGLRLVLARVLWGFSALLPLAYAFAPGATYTGLAYHWLKERTGIELARYLPSLAKKQFFFGSFPENLIPLVYVVPLMAGFVAFFATGSGKENKGQAR